MKKKISIFIGSLALSAATIWACQESELDQEVPVNQNQILQSTENSAGSVRVKIFNKNIGHVIPKELANAMANRYRSEKPGQVESHFFGRNILATLLNKPNVEGLKFVYGESETGDAILMVVGVDAEGTPTTETADYSAPCPPCEPTN